MAGSGIIWFQFGIGDLFANPLPSGNLATPSYPQWFGTMEDCQVSFKQKVVKLMGQNKIADDAAASDFEVSGKAKFARLELDIFNALLFGQQIATGGQTISPREAHSIPASTPFTITVAPPNSGTFVADRGVMFANGLTPLVPVATSPTTGQYTVSAGTYTFAAADEGQAVLISYKYSVTTGSTLSLANELQGFGPNFEIDLTLPYRTNSFPNNLHLRSCKVTDMGLPMKRDGYVVSDFGFEAYCDATGIAFDWFKSPNNG